MRLPVRSLLALSLSCSPLLAQSGGGTSPVPSGAGASPGSPGPGQELPKPGGAGTFFLDGHRNGRARELFLEELLYGRLVDVHGLDALGRVDPAPVFRDFLVGETVQSDGVDYRLIQSPTTQVARLIVLRQPGAPEPAPGAGTFGVLVRAAERAAVVVAPRAASAPLVTLVPRNAAMSLRFSDLLEDGAAAALALINDVRLHTGAPPGVPFQARIRFDANHGGISQGAFHSTRVLLDPTVSAFEASEQLTPLPLEPLGLTPSVAPNGASFLLRLPTRLNPGTGQFTRLTNLAGRALSTNGNGPVDPTSLDVVRAARAGNELDPNSGFLLDLIAPTVLGEAPVNVTQASPDPAGTPGFAFLVDWTFNSPCVDSPRLGDALEIGGRTFEVLQNGPAPGPLGTIQGARVRLAQSAGVSSAALLGSGILAARLRPDATLSACWFAVAPSPSLPPGAGLDTDSTFSLRFSEPLRVESVDPYDNFRLVLGPPGVPADALNTVVVDLLPGNEVARFALLPVLPLGHVQGTDTRYHIELISGPTGPTDLAGNPFLFAPSAGLRIALSEPSETSAGLVLRFSGADEVPGAGADLRGAFTLDTSAGMLHPRPPTFFSAPVDRTNPVPSIMIPFPAGVQTPLSPLGSKLHSVWRHCDLGWSVFDESKYDVDVVGLSWAPRGGLVVNDFYPEFEIRLAHSSRLPDEAVDPFLLPKYPNSGVLGAPHLYTENILNDSLSPQKTVHPRSLGYSVSAADLFVSSTGTVMLPYPLNRGPGPLQSYTWRDTSVLAKAGPSGAGVPLDIEVGAPLFLETEVGALAPTGAVPSIGLPLLMEYRCYPNDVGLGLNALDVSLAINTSALPAFRAYSTGGINSLGQVVVKDPDLENVPSGGLDPSGQPTLTAEDVFYLGQLDLAYRVSRVHSAWFDSGAAATDYADLRLSAIPGSSFGVSAELRGATGFSGTAGAENDAAELDAYGDLDQGSVNFLNGDTTWHGLSDDIDGARFVQVRLTLVNDLETGTSPELDLLALAFRR